MDKSLIHYIEEAEGHISLARLALHDMRQKMTGKELSSTEQEIIKIYQAIESYGVDLSCMLMDLEEEQEA